MDLRTAIERYFSAVDQWEAAYQKYYRLPGHAAKSSDLEAEQREYRDRLRELEGMLPRARQLCLKHQIRDPFSGLLRSALGQYAPQQRGESAISRNERSDVKMCLVELSSACQEWKPTSREVKPEGDKRSLLRRLFNLL